MLIWTPSSTPSEPSQSNPIIKIVGLDAAGNQYPLTLGAGLAITGTVLNTTGASSNISLTYPNNGLINYLGTNGGAEAFSNPVPAKLFGLMSSNVNDEAGYESYIGYTVEKATNKADGLPAHTANYPNSWIGFRLPAGKTITITRYLLKNRSDFNACPTAWDFEVSNNIATDTVTGWNAATWTVIDSRTAQNFAQGETKDYTATGTTCNAYRIRQTALTGNNSFGNTNHLVLNEIEVFGTYLP